tara:strand:- start:2424 stop:3404 length:981 start_codon:yes stop_codon:yes gene_type:complete
MAIKNIAVTDTIETFRTTFNDMAANDFGDIANLSGSITSTNLVDAMNETISIATSTAGWTIEDSSSTQQLIGGGDILRVFGTSNEIEAVVSATDTLTIGLPSVVSITTSVTAPTVTGGTIQLTGNTITATDSTAISFASENLITTGTINAGAITGTSITGSGATHTLGTIQISGNTISSTDSSEIDFDDRVRATSFYTNTALGQFFESGGYPRIESNQTGGSGTFGNNLLIMDANLFINQSHAVVFEGDTADANTTTLYAVDPTGTNQLNLPDETGTIISTGSTDAITESMMANDSISSIEMKTLSTLQILNSSGTPLKTIHGAGV